MLYQIIELPSDEPVQYVGCYVLKWGEVNHPTVGFVEETALLAERDALKKALKAIEQSLIPYRARDASPERAYICSRAAIKQARAALGAAEEMA